jgi:hypothetical protein
VPFTVSVRELQPSLSYGAHFVPFGVESPIDPDYELDGPAHVRAQVFGPDGGLVRTLLDADTLRGDFSVPWNLKDPSGSQVPDGRYDLRVTASNSAGEDRLDAGVSVDTQPPAITILPPLNPHNFLRIEVRDLVGVRSAVVTIDGQSTSYSTIYNLDKFLPAGTHTVSVTATDRMGHTSSATRTYTTVEPPPFNPFQCDATQAKLLVRHTPRLVSRLRKLARLGRHDDVFEGFSLAKTACVKIVSPVDEGMAILLKARHGKATPFVFATAAIPNPKVWHVAQMSTKVRIRSIAARGKHLVERRVLRGGKTRLVTLTVSLGHLVEVKK